MSYDGENKCKSCNGRGWHFMMTGEDDMTKDICDDCEGTGIKPEAEPITEDNMMTIETIKLLRPLNKMTDYADVSLFGAMKEGYGKAISEVSQFILNYENELSKEIATRYEEKY